MRAEAMSKVRLYDDKRIKLQPKEGNDMPRGDGTGPMGMGPRSGRAAGFCAGSSGPGNANPVPGRGFGMGFGRERGFGGGGRGWRHCFHATGQSGWMRFGRNVASREILTSDQKPDPRLEKQMLTRQIEALESELGLIKKRLVELNAGD